MFHFTPPAVDVLNKTQELNSELYCRFYYSLFKNKTMKVEIQEKCSFFTYNKNKDRCANFLIKRFNVPSFFSHAGGNVKLEINLTWP